MTLPFIVISFFMIALLYSTVGFGGGSSYIALLLIFNFPLVDVRWIALVCNIIVVSTSCWYFYKANILKPKTLGPLVILSVPFAFIGGIISPQTSIFKSIAAIALVGASILMISDYRKSKSKKLSSVELSGIGGGIGLLSGFIGIGGGIFLSPFLHVIKWESAKIISAAASFFILVNSIAGLAGQAISLPNINWSTCILLGLSVFFGGQVGNRMNIHILSKEKIKLVSAILIGTIGFRILYMQIF